MQRIRIWIAEIFKKTGDMSGGGAGERMGMVCASGIAQASDGRWHGSGFTFMREHDLRVQEKGQLLR